MIDMKKLLLLLFTLHFSLLISVGQTFDNLPTPVTEEKVIDNTPDSIAKALMNRPAPGSTRQGAITDRQLHHAQRYDGKRLQRTVGLGFLC